MGDVHSIALPEPWAGVALALPTRRPNQHILVWEAVLETNLNGLACPLGHGLSLPPAKFVQPSRREMPPVPSKTVTVEQGAATVVPDSTSGSTQYIGGEAAASRVPAEQSDGNASRPCCRQRRCPHINPPTEFTLMFVFGSGVLIGTQLNVDSPQHRSTSGWSRRSASTPPSASRSSTRPICVPGRRRFWHPQGAMQGVARALQRASHREPVLQSGSRRRRDGLPVRRGAQRPAGGQPARSPSRTGRTSSPTRVFNPRFDRTSADRGLSVAGDRSIQRQRRDRRLYFRLGRYRRGRPDLLHLYGVDDRRDVAIANPLIGPTSTFTATLFATDPTTNSQFSVTLNQCVASKFSFDTNIEDFAKPDFEFQAFANAAGQVMTFNFGDAA